MNYQPYTIAINGNEPGSWRSVATTCMSPLLSLERCIRKHLRHRRDYRELEALPDYLLDDVGLTRAQVIAAAQRPFFK